MKLVEQTKQIHHCFCCVTKLAKNFLGWIKGVSWDNDWPGVSEQLVIRNMESPSDLFLCWESLNHYEENEEFEHVYTWNSAVVAKDRRWKKWLNIILKLLEYEGYLTAVKSFIKYVCEIWIGNMCSLYLYYTPLGYIKI